MLSIVERSGAVAASSCPEMVASRLRTLPGMTGRRVADGDGAYEDELVDEMEGMVVGT